MSNLLVNYRMTSSILVISRYNEDIEWVRKYDNKIIYNKGDRTTIVEDMQSYVIDIPNIGREAHTFLYYIIEHYDNLPDIVVFSQGRYDDHSFMSSYIFDSLFILDEDGYSKNLMETREWEHSASTYEFRITNWKGSIVPTVRNENYGQWYERVFNKPFPIEQTNMYAGAFFSVTSNIIRKHQKEYYINIMENGDLKESSAPEAAHFMERSWSKMFTPY